MILITRKNLMTESDNIDDRLDQAEDENVSRELDDLFLSACEASLLKLKNGRDRAVFSASRYSAIEDALLKKDVYSVDTGILSETIEKELPDPEGLFENFDNILDKMDQVAAEKNIPYFTDMEGTTKAYIQYKQEHADVINEIKNSIDLMQETEKRIQLLLQHRELYYETLIKLAGRILSLT
jgi:hypothetical protein